MDQLEKIDNQLKSRPHDPILLMSLARLLLGNKDFKKAREAYRMAVLYNPRLEPEVLLDFEEHLGKDTLNIGSRMALAEFLLSLGKAEEAVLELEELLEVEPALAEVYNILGRIYIKRERIDEAILLLEKALKQQVKETALLELLAGAYVEKGRLDEAITLYEEVLQKDPGNKIILRTLAELYTRVSKFERAADRYQTMLTDDPEVMAEVMRRLEELLSRCEESVYIREGLGDAYFRAMRPADAVRLYREIVVLERSRREEIIAKYRRILKAYPDHFETSLGLAIALVSKGEFSEAVKIYEILISKHPESVDLVISGLKDILDVCPEQVLARQALSEALFVKGEIKEGVAELAAALELDSSLADQVVKRGRELLKTYPHLLKVKILLGQAYLQKGETREAVHIAEEVNALDKKFALGYVLLGDSYSQMGLGSKAEESYALALGLDPYNVQIQNRYKGKKEELIDKEIKALQDKIIEDEWRLSLHLDLGKLLFSRGRIEAAIQEFQIAVKDRVRAPFAYNFLGRAFKEQGQSETALTQFSKALHDLPEELYELSKVIRVNLGGVYEMTGQLMKAVETYESIMGEDIRFAYLKEKIKQLKDCNLSSLRQRSLVAVLNNLDEKRVIALWGCQLKTGSSKKEANLNISFGQEHNNNGFDLFMKGLFAGAKEEFALAVQIDSTFPAALNNLGVVNLMDGKIADAQISLGQAKTEEANPILILSNQGLLYLLKGEPEKALLALEEARKLGGDFSALHLNLGDAYFFLGRLEEAFSCYQKVSPLDVLHDFVERRLSFRVPEGACDESK